MYFINITLKINPFHDITMHGLKYLSIDLSYCQYSICHVIDLNMK